MKNKISQPPEAPENSSLPADNKSPNRIQSAKNWIRRKKLGLAVGASVLSIGVGAAVNPVGKELHEVETKAEWVVPTEIGFDTSIGVGIVAMLGAAGTISVDRGKTKKFITEFPQKASQNILFKSGLAVASAGSVGWGDGVIGLGGAMMVGGIGQMTISPYRAKEYISELPQKANDSLLFKSGFALATVGGVGWGGVAIGSVLAYLPSESWGALAFPAVDLAATIGSRAAIWSGIKQSATEQAQYSIQE
jgi:hypothetical protein